MNVRGPATLAAGQNATSFGRKQTEYDGSPRLGQGKGSPAGERIATDLRAHIVTTVPGSPAGERIATSEQKYGSLCFHDKDKTGVPAPTVAHSCRISIKERHMLYCARYESPVGTLSVVGSDTHLVGLWIEGQKYFQSTLTETPLPDDRQPVMLLAKSWLDRYFAGDRPSPSELPLAPAGSAFRQHIWQELCRIPYGGLTTYGRLAASVARVMGRSSMSAQAAGGAVGHNPLSIIIPCHRVVGSHGSLTGYAGGLEKKIWLLEFEGVDTSLFRIPGDTRMP